MTGRLVGDRRPRERNDPTATGKHLHSTHLDQTQDPDAVARVPATAPLKEQLHVTKSKAGLPTSVPCQKRELELSVLATSPWTSKYDPACVLKAET